MWARAVASRFPAVSAGCVTPLLLLPPQRADCDTRSSGEVFVTYNVLCSHLAPPSKYTRCKPEDLHPATRLARVQDKLLAVLKQDAVIGLQEVSMDWAAEMHVFFARHGYQSIFAQYGEPFNGRMGVVLAYPAERFVAEKVSLRHIGESLPSTPSQAPQTPPHLSEYGILSRQGLGEILGIKPENLNPNYRYAPRGPTVDVLNPRLHREWTLAAGRQNLTVLARLRRKDDSCMFCVGVYHMPCLFGSNESNQARNIHTLRLRAELAEFAAGEPFVLLGDFNLKPGSSSYELLRGTGLGHEDAPDTPLYQRIYTDMPLTSAYAAIHGAEPGPWTLDYIWVSDKCHVAACPVINASSPRPSAVEPSDHLLLQATVELNLAKKEQSA